MATKKNTSNKNLPSNYVIFTLHAVADGETRYTNSGSVVSNVRAFLSQGKEKNSDEYKPSIWFDVTAFSKDENHTGVTKAIANTQKGDLFTVKGRLAMREWTGNDGATHQQYQIIANSIEPFSFENSGNETQDEELEEEPA
jgi:single-stranded DNA-binding protein